MKASIQVIKPETLQYTNRFLFFYGNRGGGKSTTAANKVIMEAIKHPESLSLVVRKTSNSIRLSVYRTILKELEKWGIPYTSTKQSITFSNGSIIDFQSLYLSSGNRNERLKSTTYDLIWIEEATEMSVEDFQILNELLRGNKGQNQMIITFNPPPRSTNPVYTWYELHKKKAKRIFFDNRDNPMISKEYIEELEQLKEYDEGRYLRYAKGKWGVDTQQALIYTNWEEADEMPADGKEAYGLDYGYNHPSCLVRAIMKEEERTIYVQQLIYETKLLTEDIADIMEKAGVNSPIYADHEPDRNKVLTNKGFIVFKANKDVGAGIDKVKSFKLKIVNSPDIVAEIKEYSYMKDQDGNVTEKPIKIFDHSMDAMRYAIMGLQTESLQIF